MDFSEMTGLFIQSMVNMHVTYKARDYWRVASYTALWSPILAPEFSCWCPSVKHYFKKIHTTI